MGCVVCSSVNIETQTTSRKSDTFVQSMYISGKTIGKGTSSRVLVVTEKTSEIEFAMKIMSIRSKVNQELFLKEKKILTLLDHPNILKSFDFFRDSNNFYIVTELLKGGELFDRIVDKNYKITEERASAYVKTMLIAIKHCHDKNIVHRDIKPENFVFRTSDRESDMVLIDFAFAKLVEKEAEYTDIVGTPCYMAPELAAGSRYIRTGEVLMSSDLWAIGVIAYVLMTGRPPFDGHSNHGLLQNIIDKPLIFRTRMKLSKPFESFCVAILNKSPRRRMKLEDALENQWVSGGNVSKEAIPEDVIRVLNQFNKTSKFNKGITKVLTKQMEEEPTKKIEEHFNRLDRDNNGKLDANDLSNLLMEMGYTATRAKKEANAMVASSDENKDGYIELHEFAAKWQRKLLSTDESYIHTVFSVLDSDGNGQIDPTELAEVLELTDEGDDVKIMEIIKEVDTNKDGKISFKEFRAAMLEIGNFGGKRAHVGFSLRIEDINYNEKGYVEINKINLE